MDETIIKLQREVKLNRTHVLIAFWIFFSSQLLRCRTEQAFFCEDVDVDCTMYCFLKKEKELGPICFPHSGALSLLQLHCVVACGV